MLRNNYYDMVMKKPLILPGQFDKVKILSISGISEADSTTFTLNEAMGFPNLTDLDDIYKVELSNGTVMYLVENWVQSASLVVGDVLYNVTAERLSNTQAEAVKNLMISLGYGVKVTQL